MKVLNMFEDFYGLSETGETTLLRVVMRSLSSSSSTVSCPNEQKSIISGVVLCKKSCEGHNEQKYMNS